MENVRRNYIYNTLYQLLTFILPLITAPYLSRVIGADGIGTYSYHFSVAKYFVMFSMLGINNYGNRTIATIRDDRENLNESFSSIYYMQCITSTIVIICYIIFLLVSHSNIMGWAMLLFVISSMFDVNWFFFGLEQFKLTVIRNTFIKLASVVCIFIFVKTSSDIYLYGLIMASSFLVSQLVIWPFIKKYAHLVKVPWKTIIQHFKPNIVLFIPVIAVSLYKIMDKIMLGAMIDMVQVGYYENTENIISIPIALIQSLGTVMLPKMSNLMIKEKDSIKNYINASIMFVMFLSTSMSFGIMSVSKEFVPLFFGNEFLPCVELFYVLAPSCIFIGIANVIRTQFLIPARRDKVYIVSVFIGAITNVITNVILIPRFFALGAAFGTLIAEASVCIYQLFKVHKELDCEKPIMKSVPMFFAGVIMFFSLNKINVFTHYSLLAQLVAKVFLGMGIYSIVLGMIYVFPWLLAKKRRRR